MHTEGRLGDSSDGSRSPDGSSYTVDVWSSDSASSDSESEEENLASPKISCDVSERKKTYKTKCARLQRPHCLERKAKLAFFFSLSAVYLTGIWYFLREEAVLKIDLLGKGLTQGISGDRGSPWWAPLNVTSRIDHTFTPGLTSFVLFMQCPVKRSFLIVAFISEGACKGGL